MVDPIVPAPKVGRPGAAVDSLVDERGSRIDLPEDSLVEPTSDTERMVGGTSPTGWWRLGLLGLGAVILILFVLQMLNGAPGTGVQPGTPTAEPVVQAPSSP